MTYRLKMKDFWIRAGVRAVKSVAQSLITALAATSYFYEIDWKLAISTALLTGLLSVLTSISTGLPDVPEPIGGNDDGR